MEKSNETNFLSVTTSVTISEGHSLVRINTPLMHTYLKKFCQGKHNFLSLLKIVITENLFTVIRTISIGHNFIYQAQISIKVERLFINDKGRTKQSLYVNFLPVFNLKTRIY